MPNGKPVCGPQGEATPDILAIVIAILGALGTLIGIITTFVPAFQAALAGTAPAITILGVSAPAVGWLTAGAAAAVTVVVIVGFYYSRCLADPDGRDSCSSGVVESTVEAFDSATNYVFPFTANHDRVDVVVKSLYWPLVQLNALFIHCGRHADGPPLIRSYYYTEAVCGAGLGSVIGGIAGAVAGVLLGAAVMAAIGCATVILCLFALLLAALIAIAAVLVGAFIGGSIGHAATEDPDPSASTGEPIGVGNYVTTKGNLIVSGDDDGARVYWFVEETTLHGRSSNSPPFSFTDPDANLLADACPVIVEAAPPTGKGNEPSEPEPPH